MALYRLKNLPFIKIKGSTTLTAKSFGEFNPSYAVVSNYYKANTSWRVDIANPYVNQYSGGGNNALIDQIYGSSDFRTGSWQGYYGKDMDVTIDFRKKKDITKISVSLLQDIKSWIWFPKEVHFMVSKNGKDWFTVQIEKNQIPTDQYGSITQQISLTKNITTQYLRVVCKNYGVCPKWHPGAGNPTYIFADEIIVN